MATTENKDQVMKRLVNLKNAPDTYRKICVRDDLTIEERNLIKTWQKIADEQNAAENTDVYKVRGTPKNGLRLVNVTKRNKQTPTKEAPQRNQYKKYQTKEKLNQMKGQGQISMNGDLEALTFELLKKKARVARFTWSRKK